MIATKRVAGPGPGIAADGLAFCRAIVQIASDGDHRPDDRTERLLRDAGLDWRHWAQLVAGSGMARIVLDALWPTEARGWVPSDFVDLIREAAVKEAMRGLIQNEALGRINEVADEMGIEGVLLKGAALRAMARDRPSVRAPRAAGDLDLYVEPVNADRFRAALLNRGFAGEDAGARTARHHLAPIFFDGVGLEIHTRIMPDFWGLPEPEMLAHIRPSREGRALSMLDAEGFLLHTGIHATSHVFSHGLKTAWDFLWLLEQQPGVDWDRLERWIRSVWMPRSFWVPVCVLARELAIPFPEAFLRRGPADPGQRRLETIARDRLFDATEGAFDLNPVSRNVVFLLLNDSWSGRARYVASLFGRDASEARRQAIRHAPAQGWRRIPQHAAETWRDWARYRGIRRGSATSRTPRHSD